MFRYTMRFRRHRSGPKACSRWLGFDELEPRRLLTAMSVISHSMESVLWSWDDDHEEDESEDERQVIVRDLRESYPMAAEVQNRDEDEHEHETQTTERHETHERLDDDVVFREIEEHSDEDDDWHEEVASYAAGDHADDHVEPMAYRIGDDELWESEFDEWRSAESGDDESYDDRYEATRGAGEDDLEDWQEEAWIIQGQEEVITLLAEPTTEARESDQSGVLLVPTPSARQQESGESGLSGIDLTVSAEERRSSEEPPGSFATNSDEAAPASSTSARNVSETEKGASSSEVESAGASDQDEDLSDSSNGNDEQRGSPSPDVTVTANDESSRPTTEDGSVSEPLAVTDPENVPPGIGSQDDLATREQRGLRDADERETVPVPDMERVAVSSETTDPETTAATMGAGNRAVRETITRADLHLVAASTSRVVPAALLEVLPQDLTSLELALQQLLQDQTQWSRELVQWLMDPVVLRWIVVTSVALVAGEVARRRVEAMRLDEQSRAALVTLDGQAVPMRLFPEVFGPIPDDRQ